MQKVISTREEVPPPRAIAVFRVCGYPECGTVLSRYNQDRLCAVHMRVVTISRARGLGAFQRALQH